MDDLNTVVNRAKEFADDTQKQVGMAKKWIVVIAVLLSVLVVVNLAIAYKVFFGTKN